VDEVTDMFADLAKKVRATFAYVKIARADKRTEEEEVIQEEGGR
jgi:hypothetical protein